MEIWKPVVGYEGVAEVSNLGRVRSLDRTIEVVNRWGTKTKKLLRGRIRKTAKFSNGYMGVVFSRRGKCHMVHRLVASAFIPNPDNKPQVNHKNGQRDDNRECNLEWVTCSENHKHSYKSLKRKKHKFTEKTKISKDGEVLYFDSCLECSKFLGVGPGSISSAALRKHKCKGWEVVYVTCET
jgi:hypothetical protein